MPSKKSTLEIVKENATKLLSLMGTSADVDVSEDKDKTSYIVNVKSDGETGLLIGHHGETLNSVQSILQLLVKQKLGEWVRILVNVGDWREKQEDHLKALARETAERVVQTGQPQPLYNLTAAQRRIIHIELANDDNVETESMGEGLERYLVVKPKAK